MPIRDISAIERALADTSVRESVGRTLSRRPDEIRAVFEPAFRRFFEARLGDRTDVSSLSSEERLTLAAYAKLAYGYGFRIDSRLLREARGRAYLDRAWERILWARRLQPIADSGTEDRVSACRRRLSLDSLFGHPLHRIAAGAAFDRADMLLLAERGDDCSPLFFVDESGSPVRLEASDPGGTRAYFSPVRALAGDDPLSLTDILPTAFDHLVVDGRIARFGLSPRPGYYRRGDAGGAPALVELYPGCEVCTDGPTLREDQVVRAMVSRLRAERIFETRFRRLAADRSAAFVAESPYDRRLRGALRTFDRRFSTCDSVRTAAGRRDASVFALIRSLAMTLPWHVRHVWRGMMPEFVARAWGVKLDSRDAADRATAHGDTDSWGFPPAVSGTALDVHAFSFDGSSRHAFAFESDGGWVVMDFDRETYVPLAAYLRSADAYSLDTYETSRPEPGCLGA